MLNWRIWRIKKELMVEIGLIICVNSRALVNSPLHRMLEFEWEMIEDKRILESVNLWIMENKSDD